MRSRHILIVYGTGEGQTAKIAEQIGAVLHAAADQVSLVNAELTHPGDPSAFDGVIVGASVRFGRHQRAIRRWVRTHRDVLNGMPSAFFSVSGAAAEQDDRGRARAWSYVDAFLRETEWSPPMSARFGGAMAYTKYGPITRWLLARLAHRAGGPADTSRDHEFTDWAQVHRFAERFAAILPLRPEAPRRTMKRGVTVV